MRATYLLSWSNPARTPNLLRQPVAIQHLFSVIVFHLGGVAKHLVVSRLQQLLAPVMALRANGLLHARVGKIALSRGLFRHQLHDAESLSLLVRGTGQGD